ncbi:uncharacterized protein LOC127148472 [Cucumis melo]|uniref:Uncharacterized protein LOC127148472 n=1 Tax=Cucumis melo TaxID=3656 RepID=A0ABM3KK62_CUCME|nr:uncharacterized protein LOC127148472 [Cucumis melo]
MTVEQYDVEFDMLSRFVPDVVKDEKAITEKFIKGLRLDLQSIVRALRLTTHDALRLALDLSLHERADSSKASGRGLALGQNRKHVCLEVESFSGVLSVSTPSREVLLSKEKIKAYTREQEVSLTSELVVREYPDVFLDELPGLLPPREIDFAIELEPDTAPISRVPYRMAPAELKEWKKVTFLSHVVFSEGVSVDPAKIEAITSWPRSSTVSKRRLVEVGQGEDFSISSDDGLTFDRRLCVPEDSAVKVKAPRQKSAGSLQPLSVLGWKLESVSIDFITRLPRSLKGYTIIWDVVDRLTKSAHFVPGKSTYTAMHDVFHVSMLRKYVANPMHVVDFEPLQINENLSYKE